MDKVSLIECSPPDTFLSQIPRENSLRRHHSVDMLGYEITSDRADSYEAFSKYRYCFSYELIGNSVHQVMNM